MALIDLPNTLAAAFWDKQKAVLAKVPKAPVTKLGDELKALAKLHMAVDWSAFSGDKLDQAEQARERMAELEAAAGGKVKALAEQAQTVEASATKFETEAKKDKAFPKEPLAAAGAVAKAAKAYRAEVDAFMADARKALAAKVTALNAQEKKGKGDGKGDAGDAAADAKATALVRTRGLDAIRKIKKPAPGAKPIRFLVVQGRSTVATFMGPSVGPTQEKLLKSLIPDDAPYKVFKDPQGELLWEKKAVTFVSDVLPGGVAKKMQLWLKQILKLNLRLRVRRSNGDAEETDGDDIPDDLLVAGEDELAALEDESEEEPVKVTPPTTALSPGGTAPGGTSAEQKAYALRVGEIQKRLRQALLDKHPESTKIRALIGFASEKADTLHDYAGALKALDMLEQLLQAPVASAPGGAPAPTDATPGNGARKSAPGIVYTQTRLVWAATRSSIHAELQKLENAILDNYRGQVVLPEVTQGVRKLDRVLAMFDESLIYNLDKALNSTDAADKEHWHAEARTVIGRYQNYLTSDPLVRELDANPFVPIAVQASLSKTLAMLASKIV